MHKLISKVVIKKINQLSFIWHIFLNVQLVEEEG